MRRLVTAIIVLIASGIAYAQTGEQALQSQQLKQLIDAVERGDTTAIDRFWTGTVEGHAPLIEPISDRPNDALYTFIWRANSNDPKFAVRFTSSFTQRNHGPLDQLKHIANTDVWYASYRLPKHSAVGYAFIVPVSSNPSAPVIGIEERGGVKYGQYRDPLNPRTVEAIGAEISYVEGPLAKSSPYLVRDDGVTKGELRSEEIESKLLHGKRRFDVYVPPGYARTNGKYPFMLMFDGDEYQRSIPTPRILDNMIAKKAIPPIVVVFFHSPDRDRDLMPNEAFQQFMPIELIPSIRKRYRVSTVPRESAVAGFSLGGLAAVYTALQHPEIFGNAISQSGSLWWSPDFWSAPDYVPGQFLNSNSGALIKTFAERPRFPLRIYLEAGEWEEAGSLLPSRMLASVLKGKGYEVSYSEFLGAHDSYSWKQTLPGALQYIFRKH